MKTRVITGLVALAVFVPFLIFSNTWAFGFAMAVCSAISVFEIVRCVKLDKNLWVSVPLLLLGAALPMYVYFAGGHLAFLRVAVPCVLLCVLWLLAVAVFASEKISFPELSTAAFLCFYVICAFSSILFLRYYDELGAFTYLLIFIGAWITDSFAYFCGMLFGKHKLIPQISPKKTVEGSLGGILFCGLAFVLYGWILRHWLHIATDFSYFLLFVYGVVVSVVSQIGDLAMSAVKRHYQIKDYGRILPGHGGFLDRFDSILAVATVLFVLNEISSVFVAMG
jgi:phosphatidate cytidylyltransferase